MIAGDGPGDIQCGLVCRGAGIVGCECAGKELLAAVAKWHFGGGAKIKRNKILEGVDASIVEGVEV